MSIKMYAMEFEGIDETGDLLFRVKCNDGACSTVEIRTPVTPELWLEMSRKIHTALVAIHGPAGVA